MNVYTLISWDESIGKDYIPCLNVLWLNMNVYTLISWDESIG